MNDRYLFRAKRTDNGEQCIGNLVYYPDGTTDIGETGGDWMIHKVDPSTICQCTGLSDENGKKIFEGDIVGFIDCTSTENGYSEQYCRGQVTWDKETASFQVTERLSAESYEVLDRGCKVLGNIFDNAELMEEW